MTALTLQSPALLSRPSPTSSPSSSALPLTCSHPRKLRTITQARSLQTLLYFEQGQNSRGTKRNLIRPSAVSVLEPPPPPASWFKEPNPELIASQKLKLLLQLYQICTLILPILPPRDMSVDKLDSNQGQNPLFKSDGPFQVELKPVNHFEDSE